VSGLIGAPASGEDHRRVPTQGLEQRRYRFRGVLEVGVHHHELVTSGMSETDLDGTVLTEVALKPQDSDWGFINEGFPDDAIVVVTTVDDEQDLARRASGGTGSSDPIR
jgi:hypothetical protein